MVPPLALSSEPKLKTVSAAPALAPKTKPELLKRSAVTVVPCPACTLPLLVRVPALTLKAWTAITSPLLTPLPVRAICMP